MVEQNSDQRLSGMLKAVSDNTRRSLLTLVSQQGPCRVTDLADFFDMSLNAVSKHIKVLERAGLVTRKTVGRVHWIQANLHQLDAIRDWLEQLQSIWQLRLNKLEQILGGGGRANE